MDLSRHSEVTEKDLLRVTKYQRAVKRPGVATKGSGDRVHGI